MEFSISYQINVVHCKFCKRNLPLSDEYFYWNETKGLFLRPCKQCQLRKKKEKYPQLRDKQIARIMERYRNEPDFKFKVIDRYKKWVKNNPERFRQMCKKNQARYTDELRNHYVAHHFRKKYGEEPTQEMIELVRMQLKLTRICKSKKLKKG